MPRPDPTSHNHTPSRAALEAEPFEALHQALDAVTDAQFRCDAARILLLEPLTIAQLRRLRRASGQTIRPPRPAACADRSEWKYSLAVSQPTLGFIKAFMALGILHAPNYAEAGPDYCCHSRSAQSALKMALVRSVTVRERNIPAVFNYHGSYYWASRSSATNFVVYAGDRAREKTGRSHAVHCELRLRGKPTCEDLGIRTVADLAPDRLMAAFAAKVKTAAISDPEALRREIDAELDAQMREQVYKTRRRERFLYNDARTVAEQLRVETGLRSDLARRLFFISDSDALEEFAARGAWERGPAASLQHYFPKIARRHLVRADSEALLRPLRAHAHANGDQSNHTIATTTPDTDSYSKVPSPVSPSYPSPIRAEPFTSKRPRRHLIRTQP
jgi:hypothetical protein